MTSLCARRFANFSSDKLFKNVNDFLSRNKLYTQDELFVTRQ